MFVLMPVKSPVRMIKYPLSLSLILFTYVAVGSGISPVQAKGPASQITVTPSLPVPKGYRITGRIGGDLNNDGIPDSVLVVKATLKDRLETNGDGKTVDRNRRGLIVFLGTNGQFRKVMENLNCFSSENEDGGVYFPPELSVEIGRNKLYVHYRHGRYGYWKYTFRLRGADFELIGYDASNNSGPRIDRQVSINFLTKKRMERVNTNASAEGGDEVFKEKWNDISLEGLAKLSQIEDFDNLGEGGW